MTYVDELASEIKSCVPSRVLPDGDTRLLFRLYALLALTKGRSVRPEDVHDAWAIWMLDQNSNHRAIRPFDALDADTQAADVPYVRAIHAVVAKHLERTSA